MKKYLWLLLVPLCVGATIKLFTDYPNSTPVSSDFLLFQRNGTYFSSAQSQFLPVWFNNPVFTGNGSINGAFNVGGTLTVGGAVITGVTYFGDGSGLSNVASQVYLKNINDNGTNETFWSSIFNGISTFQEIDATSAYFTNLFTFLTNAQYTATDGNGKLIAGTGLPATNVLLSAGANIVFSTNGSGAITISSSGTNVITTITNNTFVNTNTFISTSNAYFNNLYVTNFYGDTNFTTNVFFVSGKGNTLIITNNLSVGGVQTNLNIAASSAVITKADQVLTNAVNAVGVFTNSATGPPSFGLIQSNVIAAGISPILNLQSSTNLLLSGISSPTNGVSTASSIDFSVPEALTNVAGAVSQTSMVNFNPTNINHAIRYYVNRTGSDQTITVGTWETDSARQTATTYINTNNTTLALMFTLYAGQFTNVTSYKTFR